MVMWREDVAWLGEVVARGCLGFVGKDFCFVGQPPDGSIV